MYAPPTPTTSSTPSPTRRSVKQQLAARRQRRHEQQAAGQPEFLLRVNPSAKKHDEQEEVSDAAAAPSPFLLALEAYKSNRRTPFHEEQAPMPQQKEKAKKKEDTIPIATKQDVPSPSPQPENFVAHVSLNTDHIVSAAGTMMLADLQHRVHAHQRGVRAVSDHVASTIGNVNECLADLMRGSTLSAPSATTTNSHLQQEHIPPSEQKEQDEQEEEELVKTLQLQLTLAAKERELLQQVRQRKEIFHRSAT